MHCLTVQELSAYAELEQTEPADFGQKYESFAALCRQQTGRSRACLETLGGSDAVDIEETSGMSLKKWLQDKYPAAPAAIFKQESRDDRVAQTTRGSMIAAPTGATYR